MTVVSVPDWFAWHEPYSDPGSALATRLAIVQGFLRCALDEAPTGEIRVLSLCAGQGHDVIGVVSDHPRGGDVRARLVERDARNVEVARRLAADARLGPERLEIVCADAPASDAAPGLAPVQVLLACGIFGNISDGDIHRCAERLPMLLAHGASVLWTRHRRPPDLTPRIRSWFEESGFEEVAGGANGVPVPRRRLGVGQGRTACSRRACGSSGSSATGAEPTGTLSAVS